MSLNEILFADYLETFQATVPQIPEDYLFTGPQPLLKALKSGQVWLIKPVLDLHHSGLPLSPLVCGYPGDRVILLDPPTQAGPLTRLTVLPLSPYPYLAMEWDYFLAEGVTSVSEEPLSIQVWNKQEILASHLAYELDQLPESSIQEITLILSEYEQGLPLESLNQTLPRGGVRMHEDGLRTRFQQLEGQRWQYLHTPVAHLQRLENMAQVLLLEIGKQEISAMQRLPDKPDDAFALIPSVLKDTRQSQTFQASTGANSHTLPQTQPQNKITLGLQEDAFVAIQFHNENSLEFYCYDPLLKPIPLALSIFFTNQEQQSVILTSDQNGLILITRTLLPQNEIIYMGMTLFGKTYCCPLKIGIS